MPSILSKILMPEWSFPYNCYEVGHTWTPSCNEAALEIGLIVFREALKLYTPLYLLTQGLQKKYDPSSFKLTLQNTLQSSVFLSFNAFSVIFLFCLSRRLMGKFYYSLCAYTPAFLGSFLAILIERPSRRPALALYVVNIATETLFRIFVARGYFNPLPRGEVGLFTISISILLWLVKKNGYGSDPVSLALKFIVGKEESKRKSHTNEIDSIKYINETTGGGNGIASPYLQQTCCPKATGSLSFLSIIYKLYEKFNRNLPKHRSCPHDGRSCPSYILIAFLRPFLIGWLFRSLWQTFSRPRKFLLQPTLLKTNILNRKSIFFGLFLGSFTSVFKGVNCLLRWVCGEAQDWHGFCAGLFAGPTMFLSPNSSITLYLTWKCIESLYCIGLKKGFIHFMNPTVNVVYALSTAQLFYAAVLEPKHIKPSYMKFLDRMTDHRLHLLNRIVLDVFGTNASAGYESYFPDLDMKYMTKRFQESVLMWLL